MQVISLLIMHACTENMFLHIGQGYLRLYPYFTYVILTRGIYCHCGTDKNMDGLWPSQKSSDIIIIIML